MLFININVFRDGNLVDKVTDPMCSSYLNSDVASLISQQAEFLITHELFRVSNSLDPDQA